jgi:hypothetical protein
MVSLAFDKECFAISAQDNVFAAIASSCRLEHGVTLSSEKVCNNGFEFIGRRQKQKIQPGHLAHA